MKILLLGEYSGFFNSLKAGLLKLNHDVTLAGRKDSFKNYPVDISFEPSFFIKKFPKFIRVAFHKVFKKDIAVFEVFFKFLIHKSKLTGFDTVFLINEQPITKVPVLERIILNFIFKNNKKVFLSACGDDYVFINSLLENRLTYHVLTPFLKNKELKKNYKYSWVYTTKAAKKHHEFVFKHIEAVIPADFDYFLAYKNHSKATPLIPFPVRTYLLDYIKPIITDKIIIFHGINKANYYKKGNDIFEKAISIIQEKYAHKIEVITSISLPYETYIQKYNTAHILLDQVYSYDQGYNALEAMAKGKVVFSGAEKNWLNYYKIEEDIVLINAKPNAIEIAEKLEWLILNPEKIIEISENARRFIDREHDYIKVAKHYSTMLKNV